MSIVTCLSISLREGLYTGEEAGGIRCEERFKTT